MIAFGVSAIIRMERHMKYLVITSSVTSQCFKTVDVIMIFFICEKPSQKYFEKNST